MQKRRSYDVAVIGGGVIGAFVARELTKYHLSVCVLEANSDVAMGASGANSGIVHGGFDPEPGTLKARFNRDGCHMMEIIAKELDIPFQMIGSLVVAQNQEEQAVLQDLMARGTENGITDLFMLDSAELHHLEPALDPKFQSALFSRHSGIICPYELTQAAMENAMHNGAELFLETPVLEIRRKANQEFVLVGEQKTVEARIVVNAAGTYSDRIYDMAVKCAEQAEIALAQAHRFKIQPKIGEYLLLDKSEGNTVQHVIFGVPGKMGKGILVSPTVDGNLLLGPTSVACKDVEKASTTAYGLKQVQSGAINLIPSVKLGAVITSFAGMRAASDQPDHDFIVGETPVKGFYNAAGIESPGLTSAPAIGAYLAEMIASCLQAMPNEQFDSHRTHVRFHKLSLEQQQMLVKQNPRYAKIVCRCESITEGEVLDAIHRPCGARTLDGVKRRTRSGMGRCQGGFCSPRVVELLAQELDVAPNQVLKGNQGSYILTTSTKGEGRQEDAYITERI